MFGDAATPISLLGASGGPYTIQFSTRYGPFLLSSLTPCCSFELYDGSIRSLQASSDVLLLPCLPGQYLEQLRCLPAPSGSYSTSNNSLGYLRSEWSLSVFVKFPCSCLCGTIATLSVGASSCAVCSEGSFSVDKSTSCSFCPVRLFHL